MPVLGRAKRGVRAFALSVALGLACICLTSARASANPGLVPEDHGFPPAPMGVSEAQSAFASNGYGIVAWVEVGVENTHRVDVSLRPPGGEWSEVQHLGLSGALINKLDVAVDADGDVAISWQEVMMPNTFTVVVSTRPAGGSFDTPERFESADEPRAGIDSLGEVTLLYTTIAANPSEEGPAVRVADAGQPLAAASAQPLSSGCGASETQLAEAPSGEAIAAFDCEGPTFALRKAGAWASSKPYEEVIVNCPEGGTSIFFGGMRVAIDNEGHATGVLEKTVREETCLEYTPATTIETREIVLAADVAGALTAGPVVATSGSGEGLASLPKDVSSPTAGIGGGSVIVAWDEADESGFNWQVETRTYGGNGTESPGAVQELSTPAKSLSPAGLAVDETGRALLTWAASSEERATTFAAFAPSGGAFGQPLPVSNPSADANDSTDSLDEAADGLISYVQSEGSTDVVHARGFDSSPPQITSTSIPQTATVGTPAAFGAQAFDVWGPVSFTWSFGDGSAIGPSPSHIFTSAGTHTVTLVATDSVGNSVSRNARVSVTALGGLAGAFGLSGVSLTNRTFRVGASPTAIDAKHRHRIPFGTTFRFVLSEAAALRISFERLLAGRTSGKKCSKPMKRLSHAKRCIRRMLEGSLSRSVREGSDRVPFSGRLGRRALRLGSYDAVLTATATGKRSTKTLRFKIVR